MKTQKLRDAVMVEAAVAGDYIMRQADGYRQMVGLE